MEYMRKLAEERIRGAMDAGLFDNLPGKGKALALDDDSNVPEEMRLSFKILKNAGCLPIEMEVRKEIYSIRQLINVTVDEQTRRELYRELNFLMLKEALRSR
jgi:hypothetical protein